jgi:hypothetical protein
MNKKEREELLIRYVDVVNDYLYEFCRKQEMDWYGWIGNEVGGVGTFNDFTFNFSDILYDINNNCKKGLIIDWYYQSVDYCMEKTFNTWINYNSYHKGLRYENLK